MAHLSEVMKLLIKTEQVSGKRLLGADFANCSYTENLPFVAIGKNSELGFAVDHAQIKNTHGAMGALVLKV